MFKKKEKKGQVAMEFLMTYGWAMIIIVVAVAALWYLGVFTPEIPNTCSIGAPYSCSDVKIIDAGGEVKPGDGIDRIQFFLSASELSSDTTNNVLVSLVVNDKTCAVPGDITIGATAGTTYTNMVAASVQTGRIIFNCDKDFGVAGDKFKGTYVITYQKSGGGQLSHDVTGKLSGTIK
ncbi:hypothetical protein CL622_04655 [archaeon]|nr:hypothetical protein [archaeon]